MQSCEGSVEEDIAVSGVRCVDIGEIGVAGCDGCEGAQYAICAVPAGEIVKFAQRFELLIQLSKRCLTFAFEVDEQNKCLLWNLIEDALPRFSRGTEIP